MKLVQIAIASAVGVIAAAFVGSAPTNASETAEKKKEEPAPANDVSVPPPVYKLPKVGKPTGRVGGGRRGITDDFPQVHAIAPDHVGFTTSQRPTLYWYLSEQAHGQLKFELTLIDEDSNEPLVDRSFPAPKSRGLQSVSLQDYGVTLVPGEEYEWSISLVLDPDDRAKDVVASGWIEVVPAPADLETRLSAAGASNAAAVYGEAGLWYDMIAAFCDQLEAHPENERLRHQLAGVLQRAGLPDAAARR